MAKKKSFRRKRKIPILATVGLIAGVSHSAGYLLNPPHDIHNFATVFCEDFTGYSIKEGNFTPTRLTKGLVPVLVGVMGSALASRLGLNRYLSQIPFVKL